MLPLNQILIGNALEILQQLPDRSVDCCVTSPPYYGLRDYGTHPQVWGGNPDCKHRWGQPLEIRDIREATKHAKTRTTDRHYGEASRQFNGNHQKHISGTFCQDCGAWRGEFGNEPTLQLYLEHLIGIFAEVHRVLKPTGTCWLNLGDAYANATAAGNKVFGNPEFNKNRPSRSAIKTPTKSISPGLKAKDLMLMPHRAAIALQEAGWWVRSDVVWEKPNAMPESTKDRPTRSHEYIFLLTKSARYFYDNEAIAEPCSFNRWGGDAFTPSKKPSPKGLHRERSVFGNGKRNKRTVWKISTRPYPDCHFAVFPIDIPLTCIKAGCPDGGTVLDPFMGAGTTALAALQLNRSFVGIELNPEYRTLAFNRIAELSPAHRNSTPELHPTNP